MLGLLGFLAVIGFFIFWGMYLGKINPEFTKQKSRKEVKKLSKWGLIVCFILAGFFLGEDEDKKETAEQIALEENLRLLATQTFNDRIDSIVEEGRKHLENENWLEARSIFKSIPSDYSGFEVKDTLMAISMVGEFLDSLIGHVSQNGWAEVPDMIESYVEANPEVNDKVPDIHPVAVRGRELLNTANLHIEGSRTLEEAREGLDIGDYEWAISRASKLNHDHPLFSEAQAIVDQAKLELDQKEKDAKQVEALAEKKRKAELAKEKAEAERLRDPEVIKAEIVKIRNKVFHIMDTVNKANGEFEDMLNADASDDELYRLAESLVSRNKNAYKEINKLDPPKNMDEDLYDIFEEGIQNLALKYWNNKQGMEVILKYFTSHDQEYVEKYKKEMAQARSREEKGFDQFVYVEEKLGIPGAYD